MSSGLGEQPQSVLRGQTELRRLRATLQREPYLNPGDVHQMDENRLHVYNSTNGMHVRVIVVQSDDDHMPLLVELYEGRYKSSPCAWARVKTAEKAFPLVVNYLELLGLRSQMWKLSDKLHALERRHRDGLMMESENGFDVLDISFAVRNDRYWYHVAVKAKSEMEWTIVISICRGKKGMDVRHRETVTGLRSWKQVYDALETRFHMQAWS